MKITCIRIKGQKPSTDQVLEIERTLRQRFERAGFITNVYAITRTSIKIGQHMRSFSLDLTKHDRNLQCSPYAERLTNLPHWDQRVEFNNIVNAVLNKFKASANVKSGPYTIRKGTECFTESDWHNQTPEWVRHNMARGYYIEPVNEKTYLERRRQRRLEAARLKRQEAKARALREACRCADDSGSCEACTKYYEKYAPELKLLQGGAQ